MNNNNKIKTQDVNIKRYTWAVKMFVLSLCLSSVFSLASQTIISSLGIVTSVFSIIIFIFISIIFDMIGIAVTSCTQEFFIEKAKQNIPGSKTALILAKNSEKVCSFCADVIGDICGILSGAGGASIIVSISTKIKSTSLTIIVSTLVSAFIAGVTIFGKACMKEKAIKHSNKIILRVGLILEKLFFRKKKKNS